MKESVRILRFVFVGTLNALITAFVVWLLMHREGEYYMRANIIAYVIAQVHNFLWCKYWIFSSDRHYRKHSLGYQVLLFVCAFTLAYCAQFLFLLLLVEGLHCNAYWAQFFGLFVYGAVNFICNKHLTFK